jgi:DNA-binding CsgD family transcriptional regulator
MIIDHALDVLGLSGAEQARYESLVASGELIHAEAEGMDRLEQLGLVIRFADSPPRWVLVPPDTVLPALISVHRTSIHLVRRWLGPEESDAAGVVEVTGGPAFYQAHERVYRGVRQEVRFCDAPPYLTPPLKPTGFELDLLARGVRFRALYDRQGVAIPGRLDTLASTIAAGEQARVTDVPMKLILSDEPLALLPLRLTPPDSQRNLLVSDPELLDALAALFELYWERAVPLDLGLGQPTPADPDAPSTEERDVLSLLTSGLTDEAIAEHLGWHPRTVRRHVHRLMTRLGTATRFQAGYHAVRRGWLSGGEVDR